MSRVFCLILAMALLLSATGCSSGPIDSVSFYYCREADQYQYFETDGVITPEQRELPGHRGDLRYLVGLYLAGPMEEGLVCPFPAQTRLQSARREQGCVTIALSDLSGSMGDSQFSMACACLTMTCMSFVSCEAVTITSGDRSITMTADTILLFDNYTTVETVTGG